MITFDARGSGRSDRPEDPALYGRDVLDALAVLDATGTERALLAGLSLGAADVAGRGRAAPRARRRGDRARLRPCRRYARPPVVGRVPLRGGPGPRRGLGALHARVLAPGLPGLRRVLRPRDVPGAPLEKPVEDCVGWGLDAGRAVLEHTMDSPSAGITREQAEALWPASAAPCSSIHGDRTASRRSSAGERIAELTGGELVVLEGVGPRPDRTRPGEGQRADAGRSRARARRPARPRRRLARAPGRTRRALFVSSPIGLGHARRDLAIARELRARVPGLEIDWLAQQPLTAALEAAGERVHPASADLASRVGALRGRRRRPRRCTCSRRSAGWTRSCSPTTCSSRPVRDEPYDLWVGDEAWEVDHFLHENPERQARAVRLPDRLRRLAAAARGRRARGVPVRRPTTPR